MKMLVICFRWDLLREKKLVKTGFFFVFNLFARRETKMKVNVPFTLLAPSPKFIIELGPATQMLPTALLQSYNIWW